MPDAKNGTVYTCEVCGTTLVVKEGGIGTLEDVVCCARPMKSSSRNSKKRARPKRK